MAIKVLVVDDSSFFRRRVSEIINSESRLEVIDVAVNGREAVEKAKTLKPDVITMDIEMQSWTVSLPFVKSWLHLLRQS